MLLKYNLTGFDVNVGAYHQWSAEVSFEQRLLMVFTNLSHSPANGKVGDAFSLAMDSD